MQIIIIIIKYYSSFI